MQTSSLIIITLCVAATLTLSAITKKIIKRYDLKKDQISDSKPQRFKLQHKYISINPFHLIIGWLRFNIQRCPCLQTFVINLTNFPITTALHFRKEPMTKRTVDLIIRIGIEIVEWISIILKEKRGNNDSKRNPEKKRKS